MIVLALVNKMLAQVKEDPASVLALYNDVRRNITTNINTAGMMVYLAQQARPGCISQAILWAFPGTSVMGAQKHAEYRSRSRCDLLEMVLDARYFLRAGGWLTENDLF